MSKHFHIKNIKNIPLEGTHALPNSRQTLVTQDELVTTNIDAFTKGFLRNGQIWDWHSHQEFDEICVVITGSGTFFWENETAPYKPEDVISIPANSRHKFEATEDSEFYFVRIKV